MQLLQPLTFKTIYLEHKLSLLYLLMSYLCVAGFLPL